MIKYKNITALGFSKLCLYLLLEAIGSWVGGQENPSDLFGDVNLQSFLPALFLSPGNRLTIHQMRKLIPLLVNKQIFVLSLTYQINVTRIPAQ